ncbi:MAG TPA: undecaprenyl-diphosphate phosphatase, partial [candidate division Zixibacteria bacterium]|nr:undecaprenyl-diphosphate phosphatase [candidate division Zixibacteria bacterium]
MQGATEFLPVSSSAHLALFQHVFVSRLDNLAFDVVLHIGTLSSLILFYRKEAGRFIYASFLKLAGKLPEKRRGDWQMVLFVLWGSIPAAAIGVGFQKFFEEAVDRPVWVSVELIITGTFLFLSRYSKPKGKELNYKNTFAIGLSQAVSILPGISRSGATIATGLFLGLERRKAADYSFLLSIPAIAGAALLEAPKLVKSQNPANEWGLFIAAAVVSFLTGLLAIYLLLKILRKHSLAGFAYYCWAVGLFFLWLNWR